MRAAAGDGDQGVPGAHGAPVDQRIALHDAHAEPGQIVVRARVQAGHFGGFAADQRAARQLTAARDAAHHARRRVHVQLAGGVVIEKKQRFGAAHGDVVGAHGHQVDADAVVAIEGHRQTQFGADAIRAGYQQGLAVARRDRAQGAKTAQAALRLGPLGARRKAANPLDKPLAGVDVHTGVAISQGGG